jgi:hypothetical protein
MNRAVTAIVVALLCMPAICFPAIFQEVTIGTDARTVAMGNAFAPIAEGASAVNLNPAGLGNTTRIQAGISYNSWLLDMSLQEINLAVPFAWGAWGADIIYVNMGVFENLDDNGYAAGKDMRPFTLQFTGACGVPVYSYCNESEDKSEAVNLMLGLSVKYLIRDIAEDFTQAFSCDMGMKLEMFGKLCAALVLKNIGIASSLNLPSALSLGMSGKLSLDAQNRLTGVVSINQQLSGTVKYNFGLEYDIGYDIGGVFFMRAGYEHDPVLMVAEGTYSGFSVGTGVRIDMMQLDYAYLQKGAAGNSQAITLTYKF